MPVPGVINLNDSTPAPPPGKRNVRWQADTNNPRNVSANYDSLGGVAVKTGSYTPIAADAGLLLSFEISTNASLTLPAPPNDKWSVMVENSGPGLLTIDPVARGLDGRVATSITLLPDQGVYLATDGSNYFTMRGLGSRIVYNEVPAGAMDGINRVFTLADEPNPPESLKLRFNGVTELFGITYILVGKTITYQRSIELPNDTEDDTLRATYRR